MTKSTALAVEKPLDSMTKEELKKDYAHWLIVGSRGAYHDYMGARCRAEDEARKRDQFLALAERLQQKAEELDPGISER